MKPSRYNYVAPQPDGGSVLFNTYTVKLVELDPRDASLAAQMLDGPGRAARGRRATGLRRLLADNGFLIADSIDELALLRAQYQGAQSPSKSLGLTLAPTLSCNFRCTYCYQTHLQQRMTPRVEAAVRRFVDRLLLPGGSLSVVWFGGEPLLRMDVIERLTRALLRLCKRKKAQYSARIITNGHLLDPETVRKLAKAKVTAAQVTLDGPSRFHDRRRPTRRGGRTFQRVFENVRAASETLQISLRMNVDQTNRDAIAEMLDLLVEHELQRKVGFYIGHTYPYTASCADVAGCCITQPDFALLGLETMMRMIELGFLSLFHQPAAHSSVCLADTAGCYVLTPSGGVANCWNEIHNADAWVGHLLRPENDAMRANAERWRSRSPFLRECVDCLLLPMCMGGCPYLFGLTGASECHPWKHHLDESVMLYHYVKTMQREAEIIGKLRDTVKVVKKLKSASERKKRRAGSGVAS